MKARLIDIGSTNVKSALYDTKSNCFSEEKSIPFPKVNKLKEPFCEISVGEVENTVLPLASKEQDALFICTQMHGYVLMNGDRAVSDYVSWKDRRAGLDKLPEPLPYFYGVRMKANLPRASVEYTKRYMTEKIAKANTFCSLGSYIAYRLCGENAAHITDLAASGFYNAKSGVADEYFLKLPKAYVDVIKIGRFKNCDVYTPCGDQQTAVYGSGAGESMILNIGTASQLCCICEGDLYGDFESRPYFHGKTLCTVTGLTGGEIMAKSTDSEMYDILLNEWRVAINKLPKKESLIVTGGAVRYRKNLITRVLNALGLKYSFSNGNETMHGLAKIAKESEK